MPHTHTKKNTFLHVKYVLGIILLIIILLILLFFKSRTVVAPQKEVAKTQSDQYAIEMDWRCPSNAWIHCSSDPKNNEEDSCDAKYLEWARIRCDNFNGATY